MVKNSKFYFQNNHTEWLILLWTRTVSHMFNFQSYKIVCESYEKVSSTVTLKTI
jgi:hypothetical protein